MSSWTSLRLSLHIQCPFPWSLVLVATYVIVLCPTSLHDRFPTIRHVLFPKSNDVAIAKLTIEHIFSCDDTFVVHFAAIKYFSSGFSNYESTNKITSKYLPLKYQITEQTVVSFQYLVHVI